MTVYNHTPNKFIRPSNTDWRYSRFNIPAITSHEPDLVLVSSASWRYSLHESAAYILGRLAPTLRSQRAFPIDGITYKSSGAVAVYTHGLLPSNAKDFPVIWQNTILDPSMLEASGMSQAAIARERESKEEAFRDATVVQVSSQAEVARLAEAFPPLADRFHAVPFYMPNIDPITQEDLDIKLTEKPGTELLFVGNAAIRKGLPQIVAAINMLSPQVRKLITLHIVSSFNDGPLLVAPNCKTLTYKNLPAVEVLRLMRRSDVLLLASRFESYGLVLIEAMAQGCACIGPSWEVQREMLGSGQFGLNTSGSAEDILKSLEQLILDGTTRRRLSRAGRDHYLDHYSPKAVASRFYAVCRFVTGQASVSERRL